MRIGLLGLGRIAAFHAETLTSLPVIEELSSPLASLHPARRDALEPSADIP